MRLCGSGLQVWGEETFQYLEQELSQVAKILGKNKFQAANKWLKSFTNTNQTVHNEVYVEDGDVCEEMAADWVCPAQSTCMKQTPSVTEKITVPYGSVIGRFHCISVSDK